MIKYVFRDKPNTLKGNPDAQKIGEALDKIKRNTNGRCNSKTFLKAAHDKSCHLHRYLEWDDKVAGEKFRLSQIREIVSLINIVDSRDEDKTLPAFVSIIDKGHRGYYPIREVLNSAHLQDAALRQAEADFASYERRLEQFGEICDAIRRVREAIRTARARQQTPHPHV
jgi:hypothetical protein